MYRAIVRARIGKRVIDRGGFTSPQNAHNFVRGWCHGKGITYVGPFGLQQRGEILDNVTGEITHGVIVTLDRHYSE